MTPTFFFRENAGRWVASRRPSILAPLVHTTGVETIEATKKLDVDEQTRHDGRRQAASSASAAETVHGRCRIVSISLCTLLVDPAVRLFTTVLLH